MKELLLPTGEKIEAFTLRRAFHVIEAHPKDFPKLAFRAVIPKPFKTVEPPTPENAQAKPLLATLASYEDAESKSGIIIQKQALPREICAAHWLRLCAMQTGKQIEVLDVVSNTFADTKISFMADGVLYAGRFAIQIVGGDALILFGYTPYNTYPEWADAFGMFLATWEFITPPSQTTIEPWSDAATGILRFKIPASWKKTPLDPAQPARGESTIFVNLDDEGELNGIIRVARADQSISEDGLSYFRSMNLSVEAVLATSELAVLPDLGGVAKLKRVKLGGPTAPKGGFEGWLVTLTGGFGWITVILLTPPESNTERFHVWAFNRRALGIVMETMTI